MVESLKTQNAEKEKAAEALTQKLETLVRDVGAGRGQREHLRQAAPGRLPAPGAGDDPCAPCTAAS